MTCNSRIRSLCLISLSLVALSGCGGTDEPPTAAQRQKPRTLALVTISADGVTVKNVSEATIPDVILLLNVNRPGATPVQAVVGDIPSNKSVTVFDADFTDIDGKRFDSTKTRIYTVAIKTPIETNSDGYKLFICSPKVCQPAPGD